MGWELAWRATVVACALAAYLYATIGKGLAVGEPAAVATVQP